MAVEIAGRTTGAERDAAESLKRRLEPALRPLDRIVIIAGAKFYGQNLKRLEPIARDHQDFVETIG